MAQVSRSVFERTVPYPPRTVPLPATSAPISNDTIYCPTLRTGVYGAAHEKIQP